MGEQRSLHGEQPMQSCRAGSRPVPSEEPLRGRQGWRPERQEARSAEAEPGAHLEALEGVSVRVGTAAGVPTAPTSLIRFPLTALLSTRGHGAGLTASELGDLGRIR